MRFLGDWTGVYIRGDNALMYYAPAVERALAALAEANKNGASPTFTDHAAQFAVESLLKLIRSCEEGVDATPANSLRPFDRCKVTP